MIAPASARPLSLPLRTPCTVARLPLRPPEARPRFTIDGGRELEDHLERTCAKIAAGVRGLVPRRRLEALVLGGGYGRGEGGVLRTDAGERPYNDLEFYVFIRGNRHLNEWRYGRALHVLGEILTPQAGVEVEFKITSRAEFVSSPVSMFSYDLAAGHQQFAGTANVLAACASHRDPARVPISEATRLLMNRSSGLLFAQERLARPAFTAADADFVRRNIAKLELALGDAVLVMLGRYHWSVRVRHQELARLSSAELPDWLDEVRRRHAAGLEFKLHPERSTARREELQAQHTAVTALAAPVWLWVEQRRLRTTFTSIQDYAHGVPDKCPELAGPRTALVNLKTRGRRVLRTPLEFRRHPRSRILTTLPLLLWNAAALSDPRSRAVVQRELETNANTFAGVMDAYRRLWVRVH